MIHIDRVNAEVEVLGSPTHGPLPEAGASPSSSAAGAISIDRLRALVIEVLRDHLRELERRGLL